MEGRTQFEGALNALAENQALNNKGAETAGAMSVDIYRSVKYWVVGLLIFSVAAGTLIGIFTARSFSQTATTMLAAIEQLAANNLRFADLEVQSRDEIGLAVGARIR